MKVLDFWPLGGAFLQEKNLIFCVKFCKMMAIGCDAISCNQRDATHSYQIMQQIQNIKEIYPGY